MCRKHLSSKTSHQNNENIGIANRASFGAKLFLTSRQQSGKPFLTERNFL